ncbi:MAG: ATP-binding protein, partial [Clostridia bacterium]|nr:ATP-binding protein [Clostridia bacterium]
KIGMWIYDLDTRYIDMQYSDGLPAGYEKRQGNIPDAFIDKKIIHPDDAEVYRDCYNRILSGAQKSDCVARIYYPPEKKYVWMHVYLVRQKDTEDGKRRALGFTIMVDNEIRSVREARESLRKTQTNPETTPDSPSSAEAVRDAISKSALPNQSERESDSGRERMKSNREIFETLYANDDAEAGVQKVLAMIGQMFSVSRVYIFENSEDGLHADNTFEWCADGIEPQIDYLQHMSYEEYGYNELFDDRGLFFAADVRTLEPKQRELFLSQGIKATIQYAMYEKGRFRGFIGFDDCHSIRPDWDKDAKTLDTLVFLSQILTVYLLKERNLQNASAYHAQLSQALEKATKANRAKSDFLSSMSHDIRTPLNGIIGMTEIILAENKDPDLLRDLEMISFSGKFLLSLLNDILDVSRIESGKMQLNPQPVSVKSFDHMIESVIVPLMREKNIAFEYRMNCGLQCARIDEVRFNQVFFNLLSNAVKFTPPNGRVIFSAISLCSLDDIEWVRFCVKDNGIGMSDEFMKRAFEPFEQANEPGFENESRQGTGLGLSIVRELVRLMGGKISVNSELGRGSEFLVDLPLEKCSMPEEDSDESSAPVSDALLAGKRVLLVEDNKINLLVAKRLLQSKGILVTSAEDGEKALSAFEASAPGTFDAVLMDVRMPVMNGLEAARRIRALERPDAGTLPIIAMTANAFDEDVEKCIAAGMNLHLSKPIEPEALFKNLLNLTHGQRKETRKS